MKTSRRLNAVMLAVTMAVVGAPLAQMEAVASQAPTVASVGTKVVGHATNAWGSVPGGRQVTVWTEANVGGKWSVSQRRTTNSSGNYVIPLTYGSNSTGAHTFRVVARHANGNVVRTSPFTLHRVPRPTAHTAGTKTVGQSTNTWGRFHRGAGIDVWTEVHTGNGWNTSQRRSANSKGDFVIPLTYGANSTGSYRYRVAGRYPDGTVVRTAEFTLKRTAGSTKHSWMRAAGIPQSDWNYVDHIVTRESNWNPNARNRSSGACGLAQALPCSKVGPNWNDPVVSLKWQHNYVKSRYGSYKGAYNFWQRNRWY